MSIKKTRDFGIFALPNCKKSRNMSTETMNETHAKSNYETGLGDWVKQEKAAIDLIRI